MVSAALGVGWGTSNDGRDATTGAVSVDAAPGNVSESGTKQKPFTIGVSTPAGAGTGSGVSPEWMEAYQTFTGCRDPLKRHGLLAEALAGITESNWESAWDPMWKSRKEGRISEEEWKLFMQKFGMVGRERLAEKGRPNDVVNSWETWNVRHGIVGWATADVAGSWDWISKQPEGNYRKGLLTGWFEAAAAVDPDRALAAMDQLDPQKDRNIRDLVARKMALHDPAKVRAYLDALSALPAKAGDPANPQPTSWVNGLYLSGPATGEQQAQEFFNRMQQEKLAMNSDPAYPPTIKAWFDTFSGSTALTAGAMGRMTTALLQSQPPAEVLSWIETFPVSHGTFHAATRAIGHWTNEQTIDDVAAWLKANRDSPVYDGAAAAFAAKAHAFDPEGARIWANTIKDESQRQSLLKSWDGK